MPNEVLHNYIERSILPLYDAFDAAHRRGHVEKVMAESLRLATFYSVDNDMVYCIAAYHDIGLCEGRERHHLVSAAMMRSDEHLRQFFSEEEIGIMAEAVEDHRASNQHEPRTIYGRIVAEADRDIVPADIIRRTVQYGMSHYPHLDREGHWQRTLDHLHEKYAEGGYLRLWLPESNNAEGLRRLRQIIADEDCLRGFFDRFYGEEVG